MSLTARSLRGTTLVSDGPPITVTPPQIEFTVHDPELYIVDICIQNMTKNKAVRVRIDANTPTNRGIINAVFFDSAKARSNAVETGRETRQLSSGLKQIVRVVLDARDPIMRSINDQLIITCEATGSHTREQHSVTVPIRVVPPHPDFRLSTAGIDFSNVLLGQTASETVRLTNVGCGEGDWELKLDNKESPLGCLAISPLAGHLAPGESAELDVSLQGGTAGVLHAVAAISYASPSADPLPTVHMVVTATIVSAMVSLMHCPSRGAPPAPLTQLRLGRIMFNTPTRRTIIVSNPTAVELPFNFRLRDTSSDVADDMSVISATTVHAPRVGPDGVEATFDPPDGTVPPFSDVPVTITFISIPEPNVVEQAQRFIQNSTIQASAGVVQEIPDDDTTRPLSAMGTETRLARPTADEKSHSMLVDLAIPSTGQVMTVPLTATGVRPHVRLSTNHLQFGEVAVRDEKTLSFTIANRSEHVSVKAVATRMPAGFSIRPEVGSIGRLQTMEYHVTYHPTTATPIHGRRDDEKIHLSLGGIIHIAIAVSGWGKYVSKNAPRPAPLTRRILSGGSTRSVTSGRGTGRQYGTKRPPTLPVHRAIRPIPIDPVSTLPEPVLGLPPVDDAIGSDRTVGQAPVLSRPRLEEVTKLVKAKFKPEPTVELEAEGCRRPIDEALLTRISTGPRHFDFGVLTMLSTSTLSFNIANDNPHALLVTLDSEDSEQLIVSPHSQVLNPGNMAGFDLTLDVKAPVESFARIVTVSINGQQCFQLSTVASVEPVRVEPSVTKLSFALNPASVFDRVIARQIVLRNPGSTIARWTSSASTADFAVVPAAGDIPANSETPIDVHWIPGAVASLSETVTIDVEGGGPVNINCTADIAPAELRTPQSSLSIGVLSVGMTKTATIVLKNPKDTEAYFQVAPPVSAMKVTPPQGCVPGGSTAELTVTVLSSQPQVLDTPIVIDVRGGAPVNVQLTADIQVPDIRAASGDTIDFGTVPVCLTVVKPIRLKNRSAIPALLFVDLTDHAEFTVAIPDDADRDVLTPVSREQMAVELQGSGDVELAPPPTADAAVHLVRVVLAPNAAVSLDVAFTPAGDETHDFPIPVTVAGLDRPPAHLLATRLVAASTRPHLLVSRHSINFGPRPVTHAITHGADSPYAATIELSNPAADPVPFCCLLPDGSPFRVTPAHGVVEPHSSEAVMVVFTPGTIVATQHRLILHYGTVATEFMRPGPDGQPPDRIAAQALAEQRAEEGYLPHTVELRGIAVEPTVTFDRSHIVLPTVPVGVPSMATFNILNQGHDDTELTVVLPPDTSRVPLTVTMPRGSRVGYNIPTLPVTVAFASKKPLSFTAKIEFADSAGRKSAVFVSGTTDTALLTVQPFLMAHHSVLHLKGVAGKPLVASLPREGPAPTPDVVSEAARATVAGKESVIKPLLGGAADGSTYLTHPALAHDGRVSAPLPVGHRGPYASRLDDISAAIDRFLEMATSDISPTEIDPTCPWSVPVWAGPDVEAAPPLLFKYLGTLQPKIFSGEQSLQGLQASPGLLAELVETVTGRPISNKMLPKTCNAEQRVAANVKLLDNVLAALKAHGALINNVHPVTLLAQRDFVHHCQTALSGALVAPSIVVRSRLAPVFSSLWTITTGPAWAAVLYQIVKLFALSSDKADPTRPATRMAAARLPLPTGSNTHSGPESALLVWINAALYETLYGPVTADDFPEAAPAALQRVAKSDRVDMTNELDVRMHAVSKRLLVTSFAQLSDGVAVGAALLHFVPNLTGLRKALVAMLLATDAARPGDMAPALKAAAEHAEPSYDVDTATAELRQAVIDAMDRLRLDLALSVSDLETGDARSMTLLALYLRQRLPAFAPRLTVTFLGKLNEDLVKDVALTNPSRRAAVYSVAVSGKGEFYIADDTVRIEPKGSVDYPVRFSPTFSKPTTGRLVFTPQKVGAAPYPEPMVIELKGDVEPGTPVDTVQESCKVYEARTIDLNIKSPFGRRGQFDVRLVQHRDPTHIHVKPNASDQKAIQQRARNRIEGRLVTPDAFTLAAQGKSMRLDPGAEKSHRLRVRFHPLQPGVYKGLLTFSDPALGEFSVAVMGTASLPDPTDVIHVVSTTGDMARDIDLPWDNVTLKRMTVSPGLPVIQQAFKDSMTIDYAVEFTGDFLTGPPEFTLTNPAKAKQGAPPNVYPLGIKSLAAGTYQCRLIARSPFDVRVLDIEVTVHEPGLDLHLAFEARVRDVIQQDIPVPNSSNKEVTFKAVLSGQGFTGPSQLRVGPGGTAGYHLTFAPVTPGPHEGTLVLTNTVSGADSTYSLTADVAEPAAEDFVSIESVARKPETHTIQVTNPFIRDTTFTVTAAESWITAPSSVTIRGKDTVPFSFEVLSNRAADLRGALSFTTSSGEYLWFAIELHAQPPDPEATISLETRCHQPVATELSITNPDDVAVQFGVELRGAQLFGDSVVMIGPRESVNYQLVYSPLVPGTGTGAAFFVSDDDDFWFEIELTALDAEPVHLQPFEAEVGHNVTQTITLDNPLDSAVRFTARNSNPQNYTIQPATDVIVPARGTGSVAVTYTPTSIATPECATVSFHSRGAGEFVFELSGSGQAPSEQPPLRIATQPGGTNTTMVIFRNPFPKVLRASISLVTEQPDSWQIVLKRPEMMQVAPFGTVQIPVCFYASSMALFSAIVRIRDLDSADNVPLIWDSPVVGLAEIPATGRTVKLVTKARTELKRRINVELYRLQETWPDDRDTLTFSATLKYPETGAEHVDQYLSVSPASFTMARGASEAALNFTFKPLRSLSAALELIVEDTVRGGRWHFDVLATATEPDIDDTVVIAAAPNTTGLVTLALSNVHQAFSPFTAVFTPESPVDFSVDPSSGVLEPVGQTPTQLTVSYSPTSYGNPQAGTLIVTTDRMEWRYLVRGTFPSYEVPKTESKVKTMIGATRRTPGTARKNFLGRNISSVKNGTRPARGQGDM